MVTRHIKDQLRNQVSVNTHYSVLYMCRLVSELDYQDSLCKSARLHWLGSIVKNNTACCISFILIHLIHA